MNEMKQTPPARLREMRGIGSVVRAAVVTSALVVASGALAPFAIAADAAAASPTGGPTAVDAMSAITLPPIRFNGSVAGDELYDRLKQDPRYAKLDRGLFGSPIELRITRASETTSGGKAAGFASAILAGGTLGLLPMVTNDDLVITYEYVVNDNVLASWSYRKNFTRSQNIYSQDKTYGLGDEGLAWVKTTVDQFLADSRTDSRLAEFVREYEFYFGAVKK